MLSTSLSPAARRGLEVTLPGIRELFLRDRRLREQDRVPGMSRAVCFPQAQLQATPRELAQHCPGRWGRTCFH